MKLFTTRDMPVLSDLSRLRGRGRQIGGGKQVMAQCVHKSCPMAQRLHPNGPLWARWMLLLVAAAALWHIPGCVVPPPESKYADNLPPFIDWTATIPAEDERSFSRSPATALEFRVDGAVDDPEGDTLYYVWYYVADEGLPTPVFGKETVSINPCDPLALRKAEVMIVAVVVSDAELDWTGDPTQPIPVQTQDGHEFAKRTWTILLQDECPPE